jgi:hypothetical protein
MVIIGTLCNVRRSAYLIACVLAHTIWRRNLFFKFNLSGRESRYETGSPMQAC